MTAATTNLTAFIFARGGSKGAPNKNIYPVAGRPLIAHAVEGALRTRRVARVLVSTDSEDIARAAESAGAEIPFMRPHALASDTASEILAWRHAIAFMRDQGRALDPFISVPTTAPLRAPEDIDAAIDRFLALRIDGRPADMVLTVTPARANPAFTMVRVSEEGWTQLLDPPNSGGPTRRQDAPKVFEITPLAYVASPDYVERTPHLMAGRVAHVVVPAERALDIDTPFDLHLADLLMRFPYAGR